MSDYDETLKAMVEAARAKIGLPERPPETPQETPPD